MAETGKPRPEALMEVITILDLLRFFLREAPEFLKEKRRPSGWLFWKTFFIRGFSAVPKFWNCSPEIV